MTRKNYFEIIRRVLCRGSQHSITQATIRQLVLPTVYRVTDMNMTKKKTTRLERVTQKPCKTMQNFKPFSSGILKDMSADLEVTRRTEE